MINSRTSGWVFRKKKPCVQAFVSVPYRKQRKSELSPYGERSWSLTCVMHFLCQFSYLCDNTKKLQLKEGRQRLKCTALNSQNTVRTSRWIHVNLPGKEQFPQLGAGLSVNWRNKTLQKSEGENYWFSGVANSVNELPLKQKALLQERKAASLQIEVRGIQV